MRNLELVEGMHRTAKDVPNFHGLSVYGDASPKGLYHSASLVLERSVAMSWEHLCEVCGKSVFLGWDARGCQILCEDCDELNKEADRVAEQTARNAH